MPKITRRRFLAGLAATASTSAGSALARLPTPQGTTADSATPKFPHDVTPFATEAPGTWPREGLPPNELNFPLRTRLPFAHGVASGDPLPDGIILWTRLTLLDYPAALLHGKWRIANDPAMTDIVTSGDFTTDASRDWTVKIDVRELASYQVYYYQFYWNGAESCVGRTRTAPADWQTLSSLRCAVCSCASYYSGYMNGYGRIADRADLDFVIHCGDYIYDYPDPDEQLRLPFNNADAASNPDIRRPDSIAALRRRYALYRSDPDLFRAHQQHPWFIIWDNHDIATSGDLTLEQAYQVFWEWTPSREVDSQDIARRYTLYRYGAMADVLFTDRYYSKARPLDADNQYSYLGDNQQQFVQQALQESQQRGAEWRIVINQAFIAQLFLINPPVRTEWVYRGLFPQRSKGIVLNNSQWDGVPTERRDLFTYMAEQKITDTVFVTGDMHMNWGSDLSADPANIQTYDANTGRGSVGVEFAPSSISRGGADETLYGLLGGAKQPWARPLAAIGSAIASAFLVQSNPNAQYMEWTNHGYGIVDLQAEQAIFEYWWTPIFKPANTETLGKQMVCYKGTHHLETARPRRATTRHSATDKPLAFAIDTRLLVNWG